MKTALFCRISEVGYCSLGTSRFNSSNQLRTTLMQGDRLRRLAKTLNREEVTVRSDVTGVAELPPFT